MMGQLFSLDSHSQVFSVTKSSRTITDSGSLGLFSLHFVQVRFGFGCITKLGSRAFASLP